MSQRKSISAIRNSIVDEILAIEIAQGSDEAHENGVIVKLRELDAGAEIANILRVAKMKHQIKSKDPVEMFIETLLNLEVTSFNDTTLTEYVPIVMSKEYEASESNFIEYLEKI